jgi:hypothetical protein
MEERAVFHLSVSSERVSYFTSGGLPPILATSPLRLTTSSFIFQLNTCGYTPYVTTSPTRGWVVYNCCWSSPAQSFSGSSPGVSYSIISKPGGPAPRIYIPQEQGGPVIPPGIGFPFRRHPRIAGLRWRYSTPPPKEILSPLSVRVYPEYL